MSNHSNGNEDAHSRFSLTIIIPCVFVVYVCLYVIKKRYFFDNVALVYQQTPSNQKLVEDSGLENE